MFKNGLRIPTRGSGAAGVQVYDLASGSAPPFTSSWRCWPRDLAESERPRGRTVTYPNQQTLPALKGPAGQARSGADTGVGSAAETEKPGKTRRPDVSGGHPTTNATQSGSGKEVQERCFFFKADSCAAWGFRGGEGARGPASLPRGGLWRR